MSALNPLVHFKLDTPFAAKITQHFEKFPVNREFFSSDLHQVYQLHFLIGILTSIASTPFLAKKYGEVYVRRVDGNLRIFVMMKEEIILHNILLSRNLKISPYMTRDEFDALKRAIGPSMPNELIIDSFVYQSEVKPTGDISMAALGLKLVDSHTSSISDLENEVSEYGAPMSSSVDLQKIIANGNLYHTVKREKKITIKFLKKVNSILYPKKLLEPNFPSYEPIAKAGYMQGFLFKSMDKFYYSLLSRSHRRTITYEKGVLSMCLPSNQELDRFAMFTFGKNKLAARRLPFDNSNRENLMVHQVNVADNPLRYQETDPREVRFTFENILHDMEHDVLINGENSIIQEYADLIRKFFTNLGLANPTSEELKAFLYGMLRTSDYQDVQVAYRRQNAGSSLEAIMITHGESRFLVTFDGSKSNHISTITDNFSKTENKLLQVNFAASDAKELMQVHASATSFSEADRLYKFEDCGLRNLKHILQRMLDPRGKAEDASQLKESLIVAFHHLFAGKRQISDTIAGFENYIRGIFSHHYIYVQQLDRPQPSVDDAKEVLFSVNSASDENVVYFTLTKNPNDVAHAVISVGQINMQHSLSLAYNVQTERLAILGLNPSTAKFNTRNVERACGRVARRKRDLACSFLSSNRDDDSKINDKEIKKVIESKNPELGDHLSRVYELSGKIQMGFLARDLLGDIAQGDIKGVIRDGSFFGGTILAHNVGSLAVDYAAKIGTTSLSRSIASFGLCLPKLAFDGYMAYQMVQQIKKKDLVGATANGAFLAIDLTECALQALVTFGVITLSPLTLPVMAIVSTILLIGINIYDTAKKVQQIDHVVHLTTEEYRYEMVREFFHIGTDSYIQELMDGKNANIFLAAQAFKAYPNIKRFLLNAAVMKDQNKVNFINNTHIDLTSKRHVQARSRKMPDTSNNQSFFCTMTDGPHTKPILQRIIDFAMYSNLFMALRSLLHKEETHLFDDFLCDNAFGISTTDAAHSEKTMFLLFDGNDNVTGFQYASNIFNLGDGFKRIKGGDQDDYFIITGERIRGSLDGADGYDTIDLSAYSKHETLVIEKETVKLGQGGAEFSMKGIESILGRQNLSDNIHVCNQFRIDMAGAANGHDEIYIDHNADSTCHQPTNLTIYLRINTHVACHSAYAKLTYLVMENCISFVESNYGTHYFYFGDTDLTDIEILNFNATNLSLQVNKTRSLLTIRGLANVIFEFGDRMKVKASNNGLVAYLEKSESVFDIIEKYNDYIQSKKFIKIVAKTDDGTLVLNHNHHDIKVNGATKRVNIILDNGNIDTHLVGHKSSENYFLLLSKISTIGKDKINLQVHTHGAKSHIDLHQFARLMHSSMGGDYGLKIDCKISGKNVELELKAVSNIFSMKVENLGRVTIIDGVKNANSINVHVYGTSELKVGENQISVEPSPIYINNSVAVILPGQLDFHSNVFINRFALRMKYYFINGTLMLTNLEDEMISDEDYTTILFYEFSSFKNKYRTIEISLIDRKIRLKDFIPALSMEGTKSINKFWSRLMPMI